MINLKDARQVIVAAEARAHEIGQPAVDAGSNLGTNSVIARGHD